MPDWEKNIGGQEWYVYAAYLKPGYHKLLIYDPEMDRAFCKDFIVMLN